MRVEHGVQWWTGQGLRRRRMQTTAASGGRRSGMIRKVISGGQEGVERAALDMARKFMIDHGGWIPMWRAREDEALVKTYRMVVLNDANYVQATERNVLNADGVLAVSRREITGKTALHIRLAERYKRPRMVLDLDANAAFDGARRAESWIRDHGIQVLNITGSQPGGDRNVYKVASGIFEALYQLMVIAPGRYVFDPRDNVTPADRRLDAFVRIPKTVDEAVAALQSTLSFQDRTRIANMEENRLGALMPSLGTYVKNEFRLWQGHHPPVEDFRSRSGWADEDPSTVIIKALRLALRSSGGVLRIVK